jgi:uncharacterized membrane protein YidH (DUF202 family)
MKVHDLPSALTRTNVLTFLALLGAVATLGLGAAAIAQGRWDDAEKALTEARDTGTEDVTAAAAYGLAYVAALLAGAVWIFQYRDFK